MLIDDLLGKDVDPKLEGALVVFNASPDATTQTISSLAGRGFALTPALANGSDAVVKTTTWDAAYRHGHGSGAVGGGARREGAGLDVGHRGAEQARGIGRHDDQDRRQGHRCRAAAAPVGTVTVTDKGKVIATAPLAAAAKGKLDIALPALGRGIHLLRVSFTGADGFADSRAVIPLPVLIH